MSSLEGVCIEEKLSVLNGLTRLENVVIEYAKIGVTVNNESVRIYNGLFRRNGMECKGLEETVWRR